MATIIYLLATLAAVAIAEPPVSNQYLPPGLQTEANFPPKGPASNQYLPPSNQYGPPGGSSPSKGSNGGSGRPSSQYGGPSSQYTPPSGQYGTPGGSQNGGNGGSSNRPSNQYGPPSNQYGAPGGGYGGSTEDPLAEPANYEFKYDVDAPEYTVKFGHQESRQGDFTKGSYYVLLPDGRTQLVEYEADQGGYRPKITYQEAQGGGNGGYGQAGPSQGGNGNGGYSGSQGGNGGYQQGSAGGNGGYQYRK